MTDPTIFNVVALRRLPTLAQGQADDLKLEELGQRTWLSRCTRDDGACCDAHVSVETRRAGRWVVTYEECHNEEGR